MPDTPPKLTAGEVTKSQVLGRMGQIAAGAGLLGSMPLGISTPLLMGGGMGSTANPCGFAGWGGGYYGTYGTYRQILNHPVVRMVRSVVHSPLLASTWYYEADEELKEQWKPKEEPPEVDPGKPLPKRPLAPPTPLDLAQRAFDAIRGRYVADALRSLDYGWAAFEPVWDITADGKWTPRRMKPLLVDSTEIVIDDNGNFIGLRPGVWTSPYSPFAMNVATELQKGDLRADKGKAVIVTHDGEAGNLYGRSRLENIRDTAWKSWLDAEQQLTAIGGKLSGRAGVIKCPAGGYIDPSTNEFRSFRDDAIIAAEAFKNGQTVILTNLAMSSEDPDLMAKLAATALVTMEVIDFGETAQAIGGLLDKQRHAEELIYNGYLRSSRTGAESQHGSRADSEQHTDSGTIDSQLIGNDIAEAAQPLMDAMCAANWGLPAGSIRIRQSPLVDSRMATYRELLKTIAADPTMLSTLVEVVDMDQVIDGADLPRDGGWDDAKALHEAKAQVQQDQQHEQAIAAIQAKGGGTNDRFASNGKGAN